MKNSKIVIKTTTLNNTNATTEIKDAKFSSETDFLASFPIPARLSIISIQVETLVKYIHRNEPTTLTCNHEIKVDNYNNSDTLWKLFLIRSNFCYTVRAMGRNAEPIMG